MLAFTLLKMLLYTPATDDPFKPVGLVHMPAGAYVLKSGSQVYWIFPRTGREAPIIAMVR
jgi:hypothetical protein